MVSPRIPPQLEYWPSGIRIIVDHLNQTANKVRNYGKISFIKNIIEIG